MTREEMCKRAWRPYQIIMFKHERMEYPIECLLTEINFDNETMILTPTQDFYKKEDFVANIKHCELPPKKLKIVK